MLARVLDSNIVIGTRDLLGCVVLELFILIVGKDNEGSGCLDILRIMLAN